MTEALALRITVLVQERPIICIPLYSNNFRPFTSVLLFGLEDAEASVSFEHGAAAKIRFTNIKIVFADNFEQVGRHDVRCEMQIDISIFHI